MHKNAQKQGLKRLKNYINIKHIVYKEIMLSFYQMIVYTVYSNRNLTF